MDGIKSKSFPLNRYGECRVCYSESTRVSSQQDKDEQVRAFQRTGARDGPWFGSFRSLIILASHQLPFTPSSHLSLRGKKQVRTKSSVLSDRVTQLRRGSGHGHGEQVSERDAAEEDGRLEGRRRERSVVSRAGAAALRHPFRAAGIRVPSPLLMMQTRPGALVIGPGPRPRMSHPW
jgi:hypothetical protein